MRRLLILLLFLVLVLPALVGAGTRYLGDRIVEAGNLATEAVDWRGGWLSSGVSIDRGLHPQLEAARLELQHGPLLVAPPGAGWLRFSGSVFPRAGGAVPLTGRLGMLGEWRVNAHLLPGSTPLDGSLTLHGRVGREPVEAEFNARRGEADLDPARVSWRGLEGRGRIANPRDPLAGGEARLSIESVSLAGVPTTRPSPLRIKGAALEARWPRLRAQHLRLGLNLNALTRGQRTISDAAISATIDNADRSVLAQVLQQLPGADLDHGPRGALAVNLATLAGGDPQIHIERIDLSTPRGDFHLEGRLGIRAGGLTADLRGEVPDAAMHYILAAWYDDAARARARLDEWIMNGLFRRRDGALAFRWVVNR